MPEEMSEDYFALRSPEEELRQQRSQERVFTELATQIRRTQELPVILDNAVQLVCQALQADRVVIYQFELAPLELASLELASLELTSLDLLPLKADTLEWAFSQDTKALDAQQIVTSAQAKQIACGRITHEFRRSEAILQTLNLGEGAECFIGVSDYKEKYRNGATQAIDNIQTTYANTPCLIELLQRAQVKAKLVAPIVVADNLWGLLIAHQCSEPRHWQKSEARFLQVIVELLAIAIHQTDLYNRLTQQAKTSEQRVIERTQELHDALNAAQSASLIKTEFLAAISHELRTPLTAIIGMATTLLRLPADSSRDRLLSIEKQHSYLKIVRNSGEHLLELINDILDLSQLEAGRAILDSREFSLAQLSTECIRILRDQAQQRGVKLELDLGFDQAADGEMGDRFIGDPRRIKQIVINLLSNAIKFTPADGIITLRVWKEDNKAFLQIEDTGIGIPSNQFPMLFKKFQQLDQSYHRQYEGTGLGLALTKQLVELHGGGIDVESTVNVGSVFTVWIPAQSLTLPINDSPEDSSAAPNTAPNGLPRSLATAQGRIVLIENHEYIATLICDLLTTAGHHIIWMMDGLTAIRQIEVLQPKLVIINAQLSGTSSSEIVEQLRQNQQSQPIKILMLATENPLDCDRWAQDCLTLPLVRPEELLDKVRQLMQG
jgi:two-component system, sensor histidine kinase and response regulator